MSSLIFRGPQAWWTPLAELRHSRPPAYSERIGACQIEQLRNLAAREPLSSFWGGYRSGVSVSGILRRQQTSLEPLVERIESARVLDRPGRIVGRTFRGKLSSGGLKDALSGSWLGRALHPMLTDVVIGSFVSASLLDLVVGDTPVLLRRAGERINAVDDRCSHRGCSLHDGTFDGDYVTCSCRGSRFDLRDGSLARGPATAPQPSFQVRGRGEILEIRRLSAGLS